MSQDSQDPAPPKATLNPRLRGGERREHFRGRSRPGRRVDVEYRRRDGKLTQSGDTKVSAVTANIGVGGAFVLSARPERVGTYLEVELRIPGQDTPVLVDAEVRWVAQARGSQMAGMGLQFSPLSVDGLRALREFFSSLSATPTPAP